jgi:hypothetical protein
MLGTKVITAHDLEISGHLVHLLDTPGFDNTHCSDQDIVNQVKHYIRQRAILDGNLSTLAGVIYLHRISSPRFAGSSVSAVSALRQLCDAQATACRLTILTTFWDAVEDGEGRRRESELRTVPGLLNNLLDNGSTLQRAPDTRSGKKDVIATLLGIGHERDLHGANAGAFYRTSPKLPGRTTTKLPLHTSNGGAPTTATSSIPSNVELPPNFSPQLLELERATLAMREDAIKSRERMLEIRENDLIKDLERQRLAAAGDQARLQQRFEARIDEERAAFQIALAAEQKQRSELDEQIQAFRKLLGKQRKLDKAKDMELHDMAQTVSDTIAFTDRRKQEQLRQIGATHETMLYLHVYLDLIEISGSYTATISTKYMLAYTRSEDEAEKVLAAYKINNKELTATEISFHLTLPCCNPIDYLTGCTWRGGEWASGTTDLDEIEGIVFCLNQTSSSRPGLYRFTAEGGRDSHGYFTMAGTLDVSQAHDNGRMALQGTKQYADRSYPLELRVVPRGLVGVCDDTGDDHKVRAFWGASHYLEDVDVERRFIRLWKG